MRGVTDGRPQPRLRLLAGAAVAATLALLGGTALAKSKKTTWRTVTQAVLKLNNHPVKTWNVYQPAKNHNLVLVQVDKRWLVIDTKARRVYRADRGDFAAHGDDLVGPEPDEHSAVVATEGWDMRDVGPAEQINVRLTDGGDVLSIQLPHPINPY
ncbi:MAG TPA: hypothetical protein VGS20_01155 [Candidatus Acidoferrales bacterium]|nr:hypothetical protein [Candidatus Acidoferrales bacterium]